MHRFFVQPGTIIEAEVDIGGEVAHQISRVLRMQKGDEICLLDGSGYEYIIRLSAIGSNEISGQVVEKKAGSGEPRCKVTLYLSLLNKADKFEWALQKCTEVGAARFVPVRSARSISDTPGRSKTERWERIIQEAAEQSGRAIVPALDDSVTLQAAFQALQKAPNNDNLAIIPALGAEHSLRSALRKATPPTNIAIFIGPEGGFTADEVEEAKKAGVEPVTLGSRTLRAETAAVAALTMALYEMGEMDDRV